MLERWVLPLLLPHIVCNYKATWSLTDQDAWSLTWPRCNSRTSPCQGDLYLLMTIMWITRAAVRGRQTPELLVYTLCNILIAFSSSAAQVLTNKSLQLWDGLKWSEVNSLSHVLDRWKHAISAVLLECWVLPLSSLVSSATTGLHEAWLDQDATLVLVNVKVTYIYWWLSCE